MGGRGIGKGGEKVVLKHFIDVYQEEEEEIRGERGEREGKREEERRGEEGRRRGGWGGVEN